MNIADEYFNNCRKIAMRYKELLGRRVRYKAFAREDGIVVGVNKAVNFIRENTYGPIKISGIPDGKPFCSGEPVLIIEGNFDELVVLETTYLGFLSYSGGATEMQGIVSAAAGVPVIDMSARHFPWQVIEEAALAAYLGGAAGTSTQAGYDYVHKWYHPDEKFKLYASLPHAMAAVVAELAEKEGLYPSVMAAKMFSEVFPDRPVTVLVDYEGSELDVAKQAYDVLGKKLFAVRLDTHGDRQMQGTIPNNSERYGREIEKFFLAKTGKTLSQVISEFQGLHSGSVSKAEKYHTGNGVTIEATFVMRDFLDSIGAKHVKIVVSSGFNKKKVSAFREANAPMDFIGTGSWLRFAMFTSDISDVWEDGAWKSRLKVGRKHAEMVSAEALFERK